MSNDLLALVGQTQDTALTQETSKDEVTAITKTGDWLPRLQVMGSTSGLVQEGKLPVGVFALVTDKTNYVDLGKQIPFLSFAFRSKAMRFNDKPISVFDRLDEEFKKIQTDSENPNSGCGWGPEFLLWIPSQNTFATLFCSSKTLRNVSGNILTIMKKGEGIYGPGAVRGEADFIKTTARSWWGAKFFPETTPLPMPSNPEEWQVKLAGEIKKFKNPPVKIIETEKAETTRAR